MYLVMWSGKCEWAESSVGSLDVLSQLLRLTEGKQNIVTFLTIQEIQGTVYRGWNDRTGGSGF